MRTYVSLVWNAFACNDKCTTIRTCFRKVMNLFVSHRRIVFRTFPWVFALQLEDKYNMEIPTQLVSLSRCLTMLEGMAMECNPDFQLVHSSFPFILEQLLRGAAQCITAHKLPISQTSFERLSLHTAQCLHVSMR